MRASCRVAAAVAATLLLPLAAGCTSSSGRTASGSSPDEAATTAVASPSSDAIRWWSTTANPVGSPIGASDPTAGADHLRASRTEYCLMLKQTIAAKGSILPDATATDPRVALSSEAFVAEIQHVAPPSIHGAWLTVGHVLLALVESHGEARNLTEIDTSGVQKAATSIGVDARQHCGLDVGSTTRR